MKKIFILFIVAFLSLSTFANTNAEDRFNENLINTNLQENVTAVSKAFVFSNCLNVFENTYDANVGELGHELALQVAWAAAVACFNNEK